ncbi:aldolase citrate lyase family [Trichoderma arundinaceum]|uniref:Aldolase citrate lyase family n=1 Tax=Trichoderma arundinaceum TaxID=490622 RepID=A0A395NLK4_TRIAR|nr:aldolase citrate lyase family [Trichoderma arundinaceum]
MSYIAAGATPGGAQATVREGNKLKALFDANKPAWGGWQMLPGATISRLLAQSGVDWVLVDCEHGGMDDRAMHEAVPAIAALGVSPIVRIPGMEPWMVKRALDTGAHGVLVPLLRTVKEAEDLVQAAKFPPWGKRGFGSPYSAKQFGPTISSNDYLNQANEAVLTMVQIETKEALDAVDEIAAVEGIDVLFVGPFDLGNNIGHRITAAGIPQELEDALTKIQAAAKKAGKKSGIYTLSAAHAKLCQQRGFDMVHVVTDYMGIEDIAKQYLTAARS